MYTVYWNFDSLTFKRNNLKTELGKRMKKDM